MRGKFLQQAIVTSHQGAWGNKAWKRGAQAWREGVAITAKNSGWQREVKVAEQETPGPQRDVRKTRESEAFSQVQFSRIPKGNERNWKETVHQPEERRR